MSEHNEITRRTFLQIAGAAPFAASALAVMQKNVPVGLELYSVRTELMKDLPGTVTAVAKMGYQVVGSCWMISGFSADRRTTDRRRSRRTG
jgi:hypothetical protein